MNRKSKIYACLDERGLLSGDISPETIAAAKKDYWNMIKRESAKKKREREYFFTVSYSKAEHKLIADAANVHKTSKTRFIKEACLALIVLIATSTERKIAAK